MHVGRGPCGACVKVEEAMCALEAEVSRLSIPAPYVVLYPEDSELEEVAIELFRLDAPRVGNETLPLSEAGPREQQKYRQAARVAWRTWETCKQRRQEKRAA